MNLHYILRDVHIPLPHSKFMRVPHKLYEKLSEMSFHILNMFLSENGTQLPIYEKEILLKDLKIYQEIDLKIILMV